MKRIIFTLLTVLITLGSWATDIRPNLVSFVVEGDTVPGYGADKLLDNYGVKTKWFVKNFGSAHIIMDAGAKVTLHRYTVWNADDTYSFPDRRWEQFSIYGSDSPTDDNANHWELIHKVDDAVILANNGGLAYEGVVQNARSYRYYKLMVTEVYGFEEMQMSDLLFTVDEEIKPKEEIDVHVGERNVVITEKTHELKPGVHYIVNQDVTKRGDNLREPMEFTKAGVAVIEFVDGHTLDLEAGENTNYPAIWLGPQSTLVLKGNGKLIVKGGNGSMGNNGENGLRGRLGGDRFVSEIFNQHTDAYGGAGGHGGAGGRGAAPAIGGKGGYGGAGGAGGSETHTHDFGSADANDGSNGNSGDAGTPSGNLIVMGDVTIDATMGMPSTTYAKGGDTAESEKYVVDFAAAAWTRNRLGTTGGGGGAGANGGMAKYTLAAGGGGGGGGGAGGASGAAIIIRDYDEMAKEIVKWNREGHRPWGMGGESGNPEKNRDMRGESFMMEKTTYTRDDWFPEHEFVGFVKGRGYRHNTGGHEGATGADGKLYVLSTSAKVSGKELGNKVDNISVAEIEKYFKTKDSECLLDDVLTYIILDDGASFSDGSKQMCFYPSMILPANLSVKYSAPKESLRGVVFYDNNGVMHLAFDKEGRATDDLYSYIAVKRDGEYHAKGNVSGKIHCVTLNAETSAMVLHRVKDSDNNVLAEYLDWKIDNLEGSDKASFNIRPYTTMEGKSIILVHEGEKVTLNSDLCHTYFKPLTVTLDRTNRDYYAVIEYVVNGMIKYTLNTEVLASHKAHFIGEYTQSSQVKSFTRIKLPRVAFDDSAEFGLKEWKANDGTRQFLLDKNAETYMVHDKEVKITPVFRREPLNRVSVEPSKFGKVYLSKTPDGEEHTDNIILSRTEPVSVYVRVVPNVRKRLKNVTLSSSRRGGERTISGDNFTPNKRVLMDWNVYPGEYEQFAVETVFYPFFGANIQNPSASDDDLGEDYGIALSTDGVNMYYDAPVFDAFMNNGSRVHAGTLDEFEYEKDDYVHLYCHTGMDDDSFSAYNLSCTLQHPEDFEGRDTDNPVDLYEKTVEVVHNADGGVADAMMKWKLYPRFSDDIDIAVNFDDDVHTLKIENYTQSHPDLLWTDVYDRTKELNSLDAPVAYMGLNGKALCDINASGDELIQLSLDNYDGIEAWAEYDEMVDDEGNKVTIVEPMKFVGDSNKIQGMHLYNTIGNAVIRILPAGFMEDILTGIKQVEIDESADKDGANAKMTIYDLSGRRIAVTSKLHGVYIMNNKKVVVR